MEDEPAYEVLQISLADLLPDPFQPRRTFREESLRELANSIRQHGVLQPLLIRPLLGSTRPGAYCIVAGERRFRAAQLAGITRVPCHVCPALTPTAMVMSLVENVRHPEVNDLEKAETLFRIKRLTGETWDQVARLVELSPDYVRRLSGLLKLEESVKEWVRVGKISTRVAIALRPLPGRVQIEVAERAVREGLTAEQIRAESNTHRKPPVTAGRITRVPCPLPTAVEVGVEGDSTSTALQRLEALSSAAQSLLDWLEAEGWDPSSSEVAHLEMLAVIQRQIGTLSRLIGPGEEEIDRTARHLAPPGLVRQ